MGADRVVVGLVILPPDQRERLTDGEHAVGARGPAGQPFSAGVHEDHGAVRVRHDHRFLERVEQRADQVRRGQGVGCGEAFDVATERNGKADRAGEVAPPRELARDPKEHRDDLAVAVQQGRGLNQRFLVRPVLRQPGRDPGGGAAGQQGVEQGGEGVPVRLGSARRHAEQAAPRIGKPILLAPEIEIEETELPVVGEAAQPVGRGKGLLFKLLALGDVENRAQGLLEVAGGTKNLEAVALDPEVASVLVPHAELQRERTGARRGRAFRHPVRGRRGVLRMEQPLPRLVGVRERVRRVSEKLFHRGREAGPAVQEVEREEADRRLLVEPGGDGVAGGEGGGGGPRPRGGACKHRGERGEVSSGGPRRRFQAEQEFDIGRQLRRHLQSLVGRGREQDLPLGLLPVRVLGGDVPGQMADQRRAHQAGGIGDPQHARRRSAAGDDPFPRKPEPGRRRLRGAGRRGGTGVRHGNVRGRGARGRYIAFAGGGGGRRFRPRSRRPGGRGWRSGCRRRATRGHDRPES
jgi:hypothetical protein